MYCTVHKSFSDVNHIHITQHPFSKNQYKLQIATNHASIPTYHTSIPIQHVYVHVYMYKRKNIFRTIRPICCSSRRSALLLIQFLRKVFRFLLNCRNVGNSLIIIGTLFQHFSHFINSVTALKHSSFSHSLALEKSGRKNREEQQRKVIVLS